MSNIRLIAAGRLKNGPLHELSEEYVKRLAGLITIQEIDSRRNETENLKAAIPKNCFLIALDENGKDFSSEDFAIQWQKWKEAHSNICLIIGGADGLDGSILKAAKVKLALGKLTWPHLLARVMLLEQIYRAEQILKGHPYHRV
ncbi:MAG: 23S rRNA (pseudouridine(1915)-N(3))-methyltransferase RlmH [Dongiaceae bacterium]